MLTHLSISGTEDIIPGLVLVSIIIDIERIGDYTKNIVELALNHPAPLKGGNFEEELIKVEEKMKDMFDQQINSFKESDVAAARKIMVDFKPSINSIPLIPGVPMRDQDTKKELEALKPGIEDRFKVTGDKKVYIRSMQVMKARLEFIDVQKQISEDAAKRNKSGDAK